MFRPNLPRHGRAAAFAFATAAVAVAAPPAAMAAPTAPAATYDQVSRESGSGSNGIWAPDVSSPVWTSDTGRHAIFSTISFKNYSPLFPFPTYKARDIVSNTTRPLGFSVDGRTISVSADAAESQLLVYRFNESFQGEWVVAPASGGPEKILYTGWASGTGRLTADGTSAVLSGGGAGVRLVSTATGEVTKTYDLGTEDDYIRLGRHSVSEDASVIAGDASFDPGYGYLTDDGFTVTAGVPVVSENGKVVAWVEDGALKIRTLASGVTESKPVPATAGGTPEIQWISPDGKRIVVGPGIVDGTLAASVIDLPSGAWSRFGGPYSTQLGGQELTFGNMPSAIISRNGRFASLRFKGQTALVDLTGRRLVGGGDPLSASAYLSNHETRDCNYNNDPAWVDQSLISGVFEIAAPWAPRPILGTVTVAFDGKVAKTAILRSPVTTNPDGTQTGGGPQARYSVKLPQTAEVVTIKAAILDQNGRVTTGTQTITPFSCSFDE